MASTARQQRAKRRAAYRRQWSAKTGRPESDIYIPVALRDPLPGEEAQLFDEGEDNVTPGVHTAASGQASSVL